MERNARFWDYVSGGLVKITIKPGQSIVHSICERTDEGWAGFTHVWTYENGIVQVDWQSYGSDCDGRYSRDGNYHCHVDRLTASYNDHAGMLLPDWETGDTSVYDEQAVLAGY